MRGIYTAVVLSDRTVSGKRTPWLNSSHICKTAWESDCRKTLWIWLTFSCPNSQRHNFPVAQLNSPGDQGDRHKQLGFGVYLDVHWKHEVCLQWLFCCWIPGRPRGHLANKVVPLAWSSLCLRGDSNTPWSQGIDDKHETWKRSSVFCGLPYRLRAVGAAVLSTERPSFR